MKRVLLLCLIATSLSGMQVPADGQTQSVQPFTAVIWTTTTLPSPVGKASTSFMRRTVYTRDAAGKVRGEIFQPTKGLLHDTTASLERVLTGSTSPPAAPSVQPSGETLVEEADLGTRQFSGFPARGKRQTFRDASGQHTRTSETWFSATLGLTVHMESHSYRGDTVFSELSELHLGNPDPSAAEAVSPAGPTIPLLKLYRSLFTLVAHMERTRLANDPDRHVNMDEIEDHLRKKLSLSTGEWHTLVAKSVDAEDYTRKLSVDATSIAAQNRAAQREHAADTVAAGRATLHRMQLDLNDHVQEDIDTLKAAVGPDATTRIQAYLQGPVAASIRRKPSRSNAQPTGTEQEQ